jgi:nucleotide-binding universal stress UspA family protein
MTQVIVSYDGTRNDRDALALGGLFAKAGAAVTLAYVRHAPEPDSARESEAQQEAEHLLAVGAELLGGGVAQKVIVNPSTASGLGDLAVELNADIIAFGSSHKTPEGRLSLPHTAQTLVERSVPCSLAIAPAGLRREPVERSIGTIGLYNGGAADPAAEATAESLAHALGAVVTDDDADLIIVPSRSEAAPGKLQLSSKALEDVDDADAPVLLLANGASLSFD